MNFGDQYKWEAEWPDKIIKTKGDNLKQAIRFSLLPQVKGLPRHDFTGIKMVRRFGRGFQSIKFNQKKLLKGLFYWENESKILKTSKSLTGQLVKGDWVGKGVDGEQWYKITEVENKSLILQTPYKGHSKPRGMQAKKLIIGKPKNNYYSCVVFEDHRAYISHLTGSVLLTPVDYELYI